MILTASKYFEQSDLMDLRLRSGIGIRSDEIAAVRAAENVRGAYAGYTKDLYYNYDDRSVVVKAFSLIESVPEESENYLNRPVLVEGRMPKAKNECVVERKLYSPETFSIGNKLTFTSPDKPIDQVLAYDTFEVVGIVISPVYIGLERDASLVGDGSVNSNVFLTESAFLLDYYTDLYVALDGVDGLDPFSEEYRKKCEQLGEPAEKAFEDSLKNRYSNMLTAAQNKISSAEQTLAFTDEVLAADTEQLKKYYAEAVKYAEALEERLGGSESLLDQVTVRNAKSKVDKLAALITDETGEVRKQYIAESEDAKAQIADAKAQLAEAPELRTLCETRFDRNDYISFRSDADKIYNVSKAFPLFFVLVAALICINAMTRMVEEQRTTIGAYKALGYGTGRILLKFLIYGSAAAVIGSQLGAAVGLKIIPSIVIRTYRVIYMIPGEETPFRIGYALLSLGVSLLLTTAASVFSCLGELRGQPSEILRPRPPKSGKRVLLEKVPAVWSRLSFVSKVTVRNLMRYKKRFAMSVVGVAGCTALIITGFGLRYSISSIIDKQFGGVFTYDALAALNTSDEAPEKALGREEITGYVPAVSKIVSAGGERHGYQTTLFAPKGDISAFVTLESPDGEKLSLSDGAVINEKLAKLCSLKKGDTVYLTDTDGMELTFKIGGIMKNYALNYVIVSEEMFTQAAGETECSVAFFNVADGTDTKALRSELIADGRILGTSFLGEQTKSLHDQVKSLDTIVILLIVCAVFLALTVLYNLAEINITERRRELATVKVLGFFDRETAAYVSRENLLSAIIGIAVGFGVGKLLHLFVVYTVEVETVMFNRELVWWAYLAGAAVTAAFTVLVNIVLYFKLKKIDMVESLKSAE